ncbi:Uncharacterised protein [Klebsiella pneumoniae]|uniref:Uncharacterized protein n=1 Tax=Klebsiella pneumoniae TaxID=573 RepID=A0A2X3F290_KLEPN|nr:Uncharacterised protein [Klebsiella pneumoniae]
MFLQRNPDTEAAPHFIYLIRHNPLNPRISFLLSPSYNESVLACTQCFLTYEKCPMYQDGRRFTGHHTAENCWICRSMDDGLLR